MAFPIVVDSLQTEAAKLGTVAMLITAVKFQKAAAKYMAMSLV